MKDRTISKDLPKFLAALISFCVIFGGWFLYQALETRRLVSTPLPGGGGRQGACVLWAVGSSSIHRWTGLEHDMRPWIAHNRGIDGATFAQVTPRFMQVQERQHPQAIILYAGENDIANGGTPRQALQNLADFLGRKTQSMGDVPVFVISMKPSPTRWHFFAQQSLFNDAAARFLRQRKDAVFVDIVPDLLVNGRPGDFYVADGVHMKPQAYQIWARAVRQALRDRLPPDVVRGCGAST